MTQLPNSLSAVLYRLILLRRLIAVCTLIVAFGILAAGWMTSGTSVLVQWQVMVPLLAGWATLIALNAVIFPAGWIDALAFSMATALFLAISPMAGVFVSLAPVENQTLVAIWALMLGGFLYVWTVCGLTWLICTVLSLLPCGQMRNVMSCHVDVAPEDLRQQVFLRPETEFNNRRTGPADENGLIQVQLRHRMHTRSDMGIEELTSSYFACILARDSESQTTMSILPNGDGSANTSVAVEHVTAEGTGSRYNLTEVHDVFDALAALSFWLTDYSRDHATALRAAAEGRPSLAIKGLPQVTLMSVMADLMMRSGLTSSAD